MTANAFAPTRHVNCCRPGSLGARGQGCLTHDVCRGTISRVPGPRHRLGGYALCTMARGR